MIEGQCFKCKHTNISMYEYPCNECNDNTDMYEEKIIKECFMCKHSDVKANEPPCIECDEYSNFISYKE